MDLNKEETTVSFPNNDKVIHENYVYQHYKGGLYFVKDIIKHTETGELLVSYIQLETGEKFARPLSMFTDDLKLPGFLFATPRFSPVSGKNVVTI